MATEFYGSCVAELDGAEAQVTSVDVTSTGGYKRVNTMGGAGVVKVTKMYDISLKAVKAIDGSSPDWINLAGGKLTLSPIESPNRRISYIDCYFESQSESYSVDNEAVFDIKIFAMKRVEE